MAYGEAVASAPVAAGTITAPAPQVTGTPSVGSTLTAATGATKPSSKTYRLTAADAGRRIKVVVVHSAAGYTSLPHTSAVTAPVR